MNEQAQKWLDDLIEAAGNLFNEYGFEDALFGLSMVADLMADDCAEEMNHKEALFFNTVKSILEKASSDIEQLNIDENVTWH